MAGISNEDLQKIREASDLVALMGERSPLRQRGSDFWCCCPFHDEKSPSCKIDPALQLWHCFGCGEGGDVFSYVMKLEDLTFPEAARWLAQRAGIEIAETGGGNHLPQSAKARLKEICKETAWFYHRSLMTSRESDAQMARDYLSSRNLGGDIPRMWQLGYASGAGALIKYLQSKGFETDEMIAANVVARANTGALRDRFFKRIMFPICDVQGDCIAFGGRVIGSGEPKYLNSQETPIFHKSEVLYGLDKAKTSLASTGVAVVVEGYTDVITLSAAGLPNVVATLGTALTARHIRILSRHAKRRIVYLFDGDAAGQRAAERALQFVDQSISSDGIQNQVDLCAVTLPDNLDPADYVSNYGIDALKGLLEQAQPLLSYGIERRLEQHDLSTPEGRIRALHSALEILAPVKSSLVAKDYAIGLAGRLHLRESDVLDALSSTKVHQAFASAPVSTQETGPAKKFSSQELNRLRFERQFLCLLAAHPREGAAFIQTLAQTQWRHPDHARLAQVAMEILEKDSALSPADFVQRAQALTSNAARILTSHLFKSGESVDVLFRYLAEELALDDAENDLGLLQAQLAVLAQDSAEYHDLYRMIMDTRKSLIQRRMEQGKLQRQLGGVE